VKRIRLSILGAAAVLPAASILMASAATNLVSNGDFAAGVDGWENFGGNPTPFFGGMALTNNHAGNGNSYYSALQCVTNIQAGSTYVLSGDAIVPDNAPEFGAASLILRYYDNDNCEGGSLGGGIDEGGVTPAERGEMMKLSVTAKAPAGATAALVRPTAQKEPTGGNTAPGELVVAFDNITLTKKLVIGPAIPDLPIKDLDPGDEPPVDPDPEEEPADEPADEPVDEPADEPTDEPADEPADEPVDETDDESKDEAAEDGNDAETPAPNQPTKGADGKGSNKGSNQPLNGAGNAPESATTAPLPPETGQGEDASDRGTMIFGGSIAAVLAGLGLLAFAFRIRRRAEATDE
jgi:hypothetical protein